LHPKETGIVDFFNKSKCHVSWRKKGKRPPLATSSCPLGAALPVLAVHPPHDVLANVGFNQCHEPTMCG
jgi:hypothetical protein